MDNVFQLFGDKSNDNPSARKSSAILAAADVLASSALLEPAIRELTRQFDTLYAVMGTLMDDPENRKRLREAVKLSCEQLAVATLELSQEISKLPELQIGETKDHSLVGNAPTRAGMRNNTV